MAARFTYDLRQGRSKNGSYIEEHGVAASYCSCIKVRNLPKNDQAFEWLRNMIMQNKPILGELLSMRVRKVCRLNDPDESDMTVFVRLYESYKHVALISLLDGRRAFGVQLRFVNSRCTHHSINDDHRHEANPGALHSTEYVRIPYEIYGASGHIRDIQWKWQEHKFGPESYDDKAAEKLYLHGRMAVKKMTEWLAKWEPSTLPPGSQDNNYVAIGAPSEHTHTNEQLCNANAQPQESTP
jgi:hypothetical protein